MKVSTPLDFERKPFHKLEVLAFDGSSYTTCEINVLVENVNDNYLTASQACFEARVTENQKQNEELITVQGNNFLCVVSFKNQFQLIVLNIKRKINCIEFYFVLVRSMYLMVQTQIGRETILTITLSVLIELL